MLTNIIVNQITVYYYIGSNNRKMFTEVQVFKEGHKNMKKSIIITSKQNWEVFVKFFMSFFEV